VSYYDVAPGMLGGGEEKATAVALQIRAIDPYRGAMLLGALAEKRHLLPTAERYYGEAAARGSQDEGKAFENWVFMMAEQQRYTAAYSAASDRLKLLPSDYAALYQLGRTTGLSGEHTAEGIAALRSARSVQRPIAERFAASSVRYWMGILLERSGDRVGAAVEMRAAVEMNPKDPKAKEALARLTAVP
jgi:tetratricopeptide (TPR) repeat protein